MEYPEQYYKKDLSDYINSLNPIFKNLGFEFWVFFLGAASLFHPKIRPILVKSYGDSLIKGFVDFFDKEVGLDVKISENKFSAKINIDNFLKIKTNLLVIEIFEQLKRKNLLDNVKKLDNDLYYFLRHLRNAAAHDNVFNLKCKDKKDVKQWRTDLNCCWRNKKIEKKLHGTSLHKFFPYSLALLIMQDVSFLLEENSGC